MSELLVRRAVTVLAGASLAALAIAKTRAKPETGLVYADDFGPSGRFFSGAAGDHVRVPTNIVGSGEQMTIELDVNPQDQIEGRYGHHKDIIRSHCYGGGAWGISTSNNFNYSGIIYAQVGWITGADRWIGAWKPVRKFAENHVKLQLDRLAGYAKLYLNGELVVDEFVGTGSKLYTSGFSIAEDCGGAFRGVIRNIRIYNALV